MSVRLLRGHPLRTPESQYSVCPSHKMGETAHFVLAGIVPQKNPVRPREWRKKITLTAVYASSAAPSFHAGGCYLCLNVIIVFPPARVLPSGKTRITHLARIERTARFVGRTYEVLHDERCLTMSVRVAQAHSPWWDIPTRTSGYPSPVRVRLADRIRRQEYLI